MAKTTHTRPGSSAAVQALEESRGRQLVDQLADKHRNRWTPSQRQRSEKCRRWLDETFFGPKFFRWLAANPKLLEHVRRTGQAEAAKGGRVSIPLIYERLRSKGAAAAAPNTTGAYRLPATLEAPLNWAFTYAYPDLGEAWDLKMVGPRKRLRSASSSTAAAPAARFVDRSTGREVSELRIPADEPVIARVGQTISVARQVAVVLYRVHSIDESAETWTVLVDRVKP
jgi:hypothetical protein